MKYYDKAIIQFKNHYSSKLGDVNLHTEKITLDNHSIITITSTDVKVGSEPRIYLHDIKVTHVIVLAHGLSDSPHYMKAIAESFCNAGANVVIPLMPAHGLNDPDKAMEDSKLNNKWAHEIDIATEVACELGTTISLGGFSKGGTLCYNKILRDPTKINGGLFLFSAAINVRLISTLGRFRFVSWIAKKSDGIIRGWGVDPFKYPKLPLFAALELGQVIHQNKKLSKNKKISQPVFAAHTIDDVTAELKAVQNLIRNHTEIGILYTLSNGMAHAELPLQNNIVLDENYTDGKPAYANPDFDLMMESCIGFYRKYVEKSVIT